MVRKFSLTEKFYHESRNLFITRPPIFIKKIRQAQSIVVSLSDMSPSHCISRYQDPTDFRKDLQM